MKCDGVIQILRCNMHFYGAGVGALAAAALAIQSHFGPRPTLALAGAVTAFWMVSSLSVSWYVYDCARVTAWQWLRDRLRSAPPRWLNIHAGLDESTETLAPMYPRSAQAVLDIYNGREMTAASIARARRIHSDRRPALPAGLDTLPFPEATQDAVFLLFAAPEVRRHERRVTLLREAGRVLAMDGRIVLVEHLRDWKNFVAFGPGFLHFYSRREWLRAAAEAKLAVESGNPP